MMSSTTQLPLELHKNNIELLLKLAKLVQESGLRWSEFGDRLFRDGIAEADAEIEALVKTDEWQKLATLPAESFWRQLQQRFGDTQAIAQIGISSQTAFASGLQEALQGWQQHAVAAAGDPWTLGDADKSWQALFKPWQDFVAGVSSQTQAAGATKGRTGKRS
ncbi:phasin family protein [Xanthomonas hortorum]